MKGIFSCCLLVLFLWGRGQQTTVSLKQAVLLVQQNQYRLQAFKEQATAASQGIALSKNTLLPEVTAGYQAGYTTFNNIMGMSYPGLIMPITGPPSANNAIDFVPGTALAALVKWNPLSFGQRSAAIEKATAQFQLANAAYSQELFRQQYAAMYTYMDAVYLHQLLNGLRANISRAQMMLEQSLELARQGLKPGIDTVQFQALLAQANVSYLTAQRGYDAQLIELARLTGLVQLPATIVLSDSAMATGYPAFPDTAKGGDNNPVLQYYQSRRQLGRAALKEVQAAWRPRLDFWGNAFARGSGVEANGLINKPDGWNLSRTNLGLGFQLSFPILQFSAVNIQEKQYQSLLKSDEAMLAQTELDLQKQLQTAAAGYEQNRQIAEQTAVLEKAASLAWEGLLLSYQGGLIDYTRLVQAQYDLLNAEVSRANACLQVWKSALDIAVAKGDLTIVLQQLK